jgi:hypothetical protein
VGMQHAWRDEKSSENVSMKTERSGIAAGKPRQPRLRWEARVWVCGLDSLP